MIQLLFTGNDSNLVINIESDAVMPGSYINADYNKPPDYKMQQLNRLADLVNTAISKVASNNQVSLISKNGIQQESTLTTVKLSSVVKALPTKAPVLKEVAEKSITPSVQVSVRPTAEITNIETLASNRVTIPLAISQEAAPQITTTGTPRNPLIISTYEDIIRQFTPGDDKVFVTGYTTSKFSIIDKYFPKTNVAVTRKTYYSKLDFVESPTLTLSNLVKTQNFNVTLTPAATGFTANLISAKPVAARPPVSLKPEPLLFKPGIIPLGAGVNNVTKLFPIDYQNNNTVRNKIRFLIPGMNYYAMILSEDHVSGVYEYVLYLDTEYPIKYIDLGNGITIFSYLRLDDQPDLTSNMVLFDGYVEDPKIISEVFIDRGLNSAYEKVKKLKNIKNLNELTKSGLGYYKINTRGYNFKNA